MRTVYAPRCHHLFLVPAYLINAPAIFLLDSFWSKIVPQKNKKIDSDCEFEEELESVFNFVEGQFVTKRNSKDNAPAI
jgi:hypothetical protein